MLLILAALSLQACVMARAPPQAGGTQQVFFIYFLRGSDGVWRIDGM
jgi:hypothetical protein